MDYSFIHFYAKGNPPALLFNFNLAMRPNCSTFAPQKTAVVAGSSNSNITTAAYSKI